MERALTKTGVKVTTVTTDDDGPGQRLLGGDRVTQINGATRIYTRKWCDFYTFAPGVLFWLWCNVNHYDVIHIHAMFSFPSTVAGIVAWLKGTPYVVRPLGTLMSYGVGQRRPWLKRLSIKLIEGPILRRAAFVHCTSEVELKETLAHGFYCNGGVIPLGVDEPLVEHGKRKESVEKSGDAMKVLFLSRIDPKKNIEGLLHAFAIVVREFPGVRLQIAGDGPAPYVATLKSLASSLLIEERVEWLGYVDGEVKTATFAAADVFVLPSYSENFGIAPVEAMLAGLPCILGQGVAISSDVKAAGAGYLVAPEAGAIAVALTQMLGDANERERIGKRARNFARREYSTAGMARRMIALYLSLSRIDHKDFH
jgi:glycosyltransferase involved in cell wall biosynthesis